MPLLTLLIPVLLLVAATVCDLRKREIPDGLPLALLVWSLLVVACGWSGVSWLDWALGVGLGLVPGAAFFALRALGGGDVKLLAGVGGLVGTGGLASLLFWTAVAGGVLATVAKWRGQKELAYGPAILAGFVVHAALQQFGEV